MSSLLQIKFTSLDEKLDGERKSKLLSPECELYKWIQKIRDLFTEHGIIFDARPPHIEITSQNTNPDELKARAQQLHHTFVKPEIHVMVNKALVVYTGVVNMYGMTHATIAYFKEGLTQQQYELIKNIIDGTATSADVDMFKQEQVKNTQYLPKDKEWRRDWWCDTCKFKIFGSKAECKKCGTKRPE